MFARRKMTDAIKARGGAEAVMVHLVALLTLLFLGSPVSVTAARAIALGYILFVVSSARLFRQRHFSPARGTTAEANRIRKF